MAGGVESLCPVSSGISSLTSPHFIGQARAHEAARPLTNTFHVVLLFREECCNHLSPLVVITDLWRLSVGLEMSTFSTMLMLPNAGTAQPKLTRAEGTMGSSSSLLGRYGNASQR